MPGAGKSTLGRALALRLKRAFIDTDTLIVERYKKPLQQLLDERGYLAMRQLENEVISQFDFGSSHVVATGGSVVYGSTAMNHLKAAGICIYLEATITTLENRITNIHQRGFNCTPGQTLQDVFCERIPLYQAFSDYTVSVDQGDLEALVTRLYKEVEPRL